MNLNVKLSITDADRNVIARKMAGKNIKRLASRSDIVELVNGFITGYLVELKHEQVRVDNPSVEQKAIEPPDLSKVPEKYAGKTVYWKASYLRTRYRT